MVTLVIKMVLELLLFAFLLWLIAADFTAWRVADIAVGWPLFIWMLIVFMANTHSLLLGDWRD